MWTLTWSFSNKRSSVFISRVLILYNLLGPYWLSNNKGDFWLIAMDTGYLLTNIRHLIVDSLFCMFLNFRWLLLFLNAILTHIMHSKNLHAVQFLQFFLTKNNITMEKYVQLQIKNDSFFMLLWFINNHVYFCLPTNFSHKSVCKILEKA